MSNERRKGIEDNGEATSVVEEVVTPFEFLQILADTISERPLQAASVAATIIGAIQQDPQGISPSVGANLSETQKATETTIKQMRGMKVIIDQYLHTPKSPVRLDTTYPGKKILALPSKPQNHSS